MMETETAPSRAMATRRVHTGGLWFGILCGPLAALTNEQTEYLQVAWSCGHFDSVTRVMLQAVPAALIVLCVIAGLVAWRARTEPLDASDEHAVYAGLSRRGFMALVGVGLSVMGILVIFAQWMPTWYLSPCIIA